MSDMKYFYSHLINLEPILTKLEEIELNEKQKHHLASLVDSLVHHHVLDQVLSALEGKDQVIFLQMFHQDSKNPRIMDFLTLKIENIAGLIIGTVEKLHLEFITDIEEAKKKTAL